MTLSSRTKNVTSRNNYYHNQCCRYSYYISTNFNFRILIIGCCFITLIAAKDLTHERLGCQLSDHQECDELCKQDSYWYGHCLSWDGRDFSCSCYEYKVPLNGNLCRKMQRICKEYCIARGLEGGYCYVYASWSAPNGTTQCQCFQDLLTPSRW